MKRLRIPAVLAMSLLGCDGKKPVIDAMVAGDGCLVKCFDDGTDAGVCPDPPICVSDTGQCPGGCSCSAYCFPDVPGACPSNPLSCANPQRECPEGCRPVG